MHFKKNRKGYICGSFNKHGIKACSSHIIREQNLKDIILSDIDFILTTISNKSFLDNISSNLNKESKSSKNKLDSIETKISKLTTRKNNALNKFIDDCISKDDYDNLVESINSELNELKSEKLLLESTMSTNLNCHGGAAGHGEHLLYRHARRHGLSDDAARAAGDPQVE